MEVESEEEVNFAERAEVAVDPPRRLWRSHCVSSAEVRLLARRRGMINPDEDDDEDEDEDEEEENKLEDEVVVVPVELRVLGALAPNRSPSGVSSNQDIETVYHGLRATSDVSTKNERSILKLLRVSRGCLCVFVHSK